MMLSRATAIAIFWYCSVQQHSCSGKRIDMNAAARIQATHAAEASNMSSDENSTLAAGATELCQALPQLNRMGIRAMSRMPDGEFNVFNRWTMSIACEKKKSMGGLGKSTYHFDVTMKSSKGPLLQFKSAVGKDKFMMSETDFKIPIGSVLRGSFALAAGVQKDFTDVFSTTAEDFYQKSYVIFGSMDGGTVVPNIGMRATNTGGFAMKENTFPQPHGFCSFMGERDSKQLLINSLLIPKVHQPAELDACLQACETHINPWQQCLAITYDPGDKWCELAINDGHLPDGYRVLTMSKREWKEMVKVGNLVQLQEVTEEHQCETCDCYVKDFDQPKLVEPEPVFLTPP